MYIVITIDTETDIINGNIIPVSKMIYGNIEGKYYGITRIMESCEKHNFKATFFVSTLEAAFLKKNEIRDVCKYIYHRGHDVQLHTHPKWITGKPFMWNHSREEQRELLLIGKKNIKKWIGEYPVAHRAGGFGSDENTLAALHEADIPIDSSFIDHPYCRLKNVFKMENVVQVSGKGILELPVTQFTQFKLMRFQPQKPFDINANSLSELQFIVSAAKKGRIPVLTLLMHSFSFITRNKSKTAFSPNKHDLNKFETFLDYLKKDEDVRVITIKDFYKKYKDNPDCFPQGNWLPVSGYQRSTARAFRYVNKGKGNKLIVLSILTGTCIVLLGLIAVFL
jgi:peptidoglycan/xylan/chitin deacetylase (PgdA/CDA1 family)